MNAPRLQTRKPTGLPSWPIALLAGREGAGKSWAAAEASGSELVGRTLWIGIGEDDPDEYGEVPGADFEIVEHDGTFAGILGAVQAATAEPRGDLPTLLVGDSMTRLWNLISDNAQAIANRRAKGKRNQDGDFSITPDLWNQAAGQWAAVMDAFRAHRGPVILTARLDEVVVMENGQPTGERTWKVQAHKSLPFDAAAIVQMHQRGHYLLTKVKSARYPLEKPREIAGFTVDTLWRSLGLQSGEIGQRTHAEVRTDEAGPAQAAPRQSAEQAELRAKVSDVLERAKQAASYEQLRDVYERAGTAGLLKVVVEQDGRDVEALLVERREVLKSAAPAPKAAPAEAAADEPRELEEIEAEREEALEASKAAGK